MTVQEFLKLEKIDDDLMDEWSMISLIKSILTFSLLIVCMYWADKCGPIGRLLFFLYLLNSVRTN